MESNQELYKQAILDAKAVRETAMAAARTTLAEHFEPMVKSMFNETVDSIQEEELSDEDHAKLKAAAEKNHQERSIAEDDGMEDEGMNPTMDEATLEEILAELDALSEDMDGNTIDEGDKNGSYSEKAKVTRGETGYDEKAKATHGDHKLHEEDESMMDEDEDEEEGAEDGAADIAPAEGDETIEISVSELADALRSVITQLTGGEMDDMGALDAGTDLAADLGTDDAGEEDEISLDEILAELEEEESKKMEEAAEAGKIPGGEVDPKAGDVYQIEEVRSELNEAVKTIKALKTELNEINLFSAKLLYVNKIFKARNLTESQKTKVINAFDRTTTVKEVENTYKTLLESISAETVKKSSLKESVGFASKPIGNAPARPIVEADAFVTRWQQLAGIK